MIHIDVLNRDAISNYHTYKSHIAISICDPYDDFPKIPNVISRVGLLQLQFHDWNGEQMVKIMNDYPNSEQAKKMVFFSKEHAEKIVEFVKFNLKDISVIICQCDAGISRSAGVAAALSKCINGDDMFFFKRYLPNSLVYKTILEVWNDLSE